MLKINIRKAIRKLFKVTVYALITLSAVCLGLLLIKAFLDFLGTAALTTAIALILYYAFTLTRRLA